jgi:hypothetical protein
MDWVQALGQLADLLPSWAGRPIHRAGTFVAAAALPRSEAMWMRGQLRESEQQARLLAVGESPWVRYLPERLLRPGFEVEPLGRLRAPFLARMLERHRDEADLVCVRAEPGWARLALGTESLEVPEWVGAFIDVPDDLESHFRVGESRYADVRRLRKQGFTWEISHSLSDLRVFYRDFHVPSIQRKFGAHAYVASIWPWERKFSHGGLLWILHEGRRVAGQFFVFDGKCLRLVATGGLESPQARAGFAGLYAFALIYARALGIRAVNLGGSRPTLRDGVFRYKRKWGARFGIKADQYFNHYLWWQRPSPAVRELLVSNPLAVRDGAGLSALAVTPGDDAAQPLILAKELRTLGFVRTLIVAGPAGPVVPPDNVELLDPRCADSSRELMRAIRGTRQR